MHLAEITGDIQCCSLFSKWLIGCIVREGLWEFVRLKSVVQPDSLLDVKTILCRTWP